MCNQQDLTTWMNAALGVEGTYVKTIYVAPNPEGREFWMWIAVDDRTLKWKNP